MICFFIFYLSLTWNGELFNFLVHFFPDRGGKRTEGPKTRRISAGKGASRRRRWRRRQTSVSGFHPFPLRGTQTESTDAAFTNIISGGFCWACGAEIWTESRRKTVNFIPKMNGCSWNLVRYFHGHWIFLNKFHPLFHWRCFIVSSHIYQQKAQHRWDFRATLHLIVDLFVTSHQLQVRI